MLAHDSSIMFYKSGLKYFVIKYEKVFLRSGKQTLYFSSKFDFAISLYYIKKIKIKK